MSNRRARNHRKAAKRRAKILAQRFPDIHGFDVSLQERDYGHRLTVVVTRQADNLKNGVTTFADRLWRHMDQEPSRLLAKIVPWFDTQSIRTQTHG